MPTSDLEVGPPDPLPLTLGEAAGATGRGGVRLVIVDPHELYRAGLRAVLEAAPGTRVVGEAATAREAFELCRTVRPDVVVTDIALPDANGPELVRRLRQGAAGARVIVLSDLGAPDVVLAALHAGASAYLRKGVAARDLASAVDRAMAGQAFIDPGLAGEVLQALAGAAPSPLIRRPDPLTPRETEVMREVASGRSTKEIAYDLHVAAGTVKAHIERILQKLGAANRAEATMRAVQLGLLDTTAEGPRAAADVAER